jgi:hypothetical protein
VRELREDVLGFWAVEGVRVVGMRDEVGRFEDVGWLGGRGVVVVVGAREGEYFLVPGCRQGDGGFFS